MPSEIQNLVDERVKLITDARAFLKECEDDHGSMSDDEVARFNAMHDGSDKLKAQIDELEASEKASADRLLRQQAAEEDLNRLQSSNDFQRLLNQQPGSQGVSTGGQSVNRLEAVDNVLQGWANDGRNSVDPEQLKASGCSWDAKAGGLYIPLSNQAPQRLADLQNAQSIGTTTAGGHTTFPGFVSNLERALLQFGGMRQVSTILRTATGSALDWPTVNDTGNTGALLAENTQDAEQDVTFGNLTLDAYKYTSKIVRVSVELMQDSAFNMGSTLGSLLGERLGRIQNTHATTGTGSSQPNGVVTAATLGKTAAATGAVTMDELLDLQASVDPAYRMGSTWMFNDATRNAVRQLKSTDSVYHWSPGATAGDPDRLFTAPVVVNQDMASMATTTKPVLFGQLSKYLMREVLGVTLVRMNERYADYHQVAFVAIMRFDGDLLDAGTNPVKYLQMA
jgi:HK97 family phage major capsid protein